jgi:hypothetical protein
MEVVQHIAGTGVHGGRFLPRADCSTTGCSSDRSSISTQHSSSIDPAQYGTIEQQRTSDASGSK